MKNKVKFLVWGVGTVMAMAGFAGVSWAEVCLDSRDDMAKARGLQEVWGYELQPTPGGDDDRHYTLLEHDDGRGCAEAEERGYEPGEGLVEAADARIADLQLETDLSHVTTEDLSRVQLMWGPPSMAAGVLGLGSLVPSRAAWSWLIGPTRKVWLRLATGSVVVGYVLQRWLQNQVSMEQVLLNADGSWEGEESLSSALDQETSQDPLASEQQGPQHGPKAFAPLGPQEERDEDEKDIEEHLESEEFACCDGEILHRVFQTYRSTPQQVEELSKLLSQDSVQSYLLQYGHKLTRLGQDINAFHGIYYQMLRTVDRNHAHAQYENLGAYVARRVFDTHMESQHWNTYSPHMGSPMRWKNPFELQQEQERETALTQQKFITAPFEVFGLKMLKLARALSQLSEDLKAAGEEEVYVRIEHAVEPVIDSLHSLGTELMTLQDRLSVHSQSFDEYFFYPITIMNKQELYSLQSGFNLDEFTRLMQTFGHYLAQRARAFDEDAPDLFMPHEFPLLHGYKHPEERLKLALSVAIYLLGPVREDVWKLLYLDEYHLDHHSDLRTEHRPHRISYEDHRQTLRTWINTITHDPHEYVRYSAQKPSHDEESFLHSQFTQTFVRVLGFLHALRKHYGLKKDDVERYITAWKSASPQARKALLAMPLHLSQHSNESMRILWRTGSNLLESIFHFQYWDAYASLAEGRSRKQTSFHRRYWLFERAAYEIEGAPDHALAPELKDDLKHVESFLQNFSYKKSFYEHGAHITRLVEPDYLLKQEGLVSFLRIYPSLHQMSHSLEQVLTLLR